MPRCGTLFGTKRLFEAKRADKHAALRVDPRVKTAFYGIKAFHSAYCACPASPFASSLRDDLILLNDSGVIPRYVAM